MNVRRPWDKPADPAAEPAVQRPWRNGAKAKTNGAQADEKPTAAPSGSNGAQASEAAPEAAAPQPNRADIDRHLFSLFSPVFVHPYPAAWIEIAFADPATDGEIKAAKPFSAFALEQAAAFAAEKNAAGFNIYIGVALRQGEPGPTGRASGKNFLATSRLWSEFDRDGDAARIDAILKEHKLTPSEVVITGTMPHLRAHVYFRIEGKPPPDQAPATAVTAANATLKTLFGSDNVENADRLLRLAGTVAYPTKDKAERGYVPELVTLQPEPDPPSYSVERIIGLVGKPQASASKPNGGPADWQTPTDNIRAGQKLHASLCSLAAKLRASGMNGGAATNFLRDQMHSSSAKQDTPARWQERYDDIPRLVASAEKFRPAEAADEKFDLEAFLAADAAAKANGSAPSGLAEWDAGDDIELPPPRGWLLGNAFARGFLSSLMAEGGVGKSATRYAQYVSLATGRALTGEHVFQRCRVLIVSLEDDEQELRRRIWAVRLHYNITAADLKGHLFLSAPGARGGKLLTTDNRGQLVRGKLADYLESVIVARNIDLIALDPFVKSHSVEENSNSAIDDVAQIITDLCFKYNLAADVPHHVSKGTAAPGNASGGRGASAHKDACRLVYTLCPMSENEAENLGISEDERRRLIRIDSAKVNIVPTHMAKWFRLVGVPLGNATAMYPSGDNVQTIEPWKPPSTWADLNIDLLNQILTAIDTGLPDGNRYTDAPNADERAAWKVVAEHAPDKTKAQGREIIKTWVKNGVLVPFQYENPATRKEVRGLKVDATKRPGTADPILSL